MKRLVNYKVRTADGATFDTTSYKVATSNGNRIEKTYLTEVDETTEKQREELRAHALKYQAKMKERG